MGNNMQTDSSVVHATSKHQPQATVTDPQNQIENTSNKDGMWNMLMN
jgi:hypothetical protein